MAISYRKAAEPDVPELAALRWEFKNAEQDGPDVVSSSDFLEVCERFFRDGIANGTWTHWIAEEAGKIVAVVSVQVIAKIPKPGCLKNQYGYVTNVYTKPAWRRQGIGACLLNCVKEWATGAGLEFLIVWPSEAAIDFYERCGFVSEKEAMVWQV